MSVCAVWCVCMFVDVTLKGPLVPPPLLLSTQVHKVDTMVSYKVDEDY